MTHVHAPVIKTNADIAAKARDIHPVQFVKRLLLTSALFLLTAVGWTAGTAWFVLVFSILWTLHRTSWCVMVMRYGFVKGARFSIVPRE